MPCPTGQNCGTVVAGPTQNIGQNQVVQLRLSGFVPADNAITVYYCSDPNGGSQLEPPSQNSNPPWCSEGGTQNYLATEPVFPVTYPQSNDQSLTAGSALTNMEGAFAAGLPGIPSTQFIDRTDHGLSSFDCDGTAANACSIVITDTSLSPGDLTTDSSNSVEIPITFLQAPHGCTPAQIQVESEFGIEIVGAIQASLSCAQSPSTAVIPTLTANDGYAAVQALAAGSVQIAFTDNPEAIDQQSVLRSGPYQLIPIALSANVVGSYSQIFDGSFRYPFDQLKLTPNMAAGLLTNLYAQSYSADDSDSCIGPSANSQGQCTSPTCFISTTSCALFNQLNYVSGFFQFAQDAAYQRGDAAGSTGQLFNWLCNAPTVPINYGKKYPPGQTEKESGAQVLEAGLSTLTGTPATTCPTGIEQMPGLLGNNPFFGVASTAPLQATDAEKYVSNAQGERGASDVFADMNWAEALYNGLSVASLQNAAGQFVQPSATSLDAALNDATVNADGSITPSYSNFSDTTAYPMPSVIYAAVSTTPTSATNASEEAGYLNQLLSITGTAGANSADLPQGFAPLPSNLVSEAQADIKKDIVAAPTPPGGGGGGGSGGSGGSGATAPSGSSTAPGASGSQLPPNSLGPSGLLGGAPFNTLPLIAGISPLAGVLATSLAHASAATKGGRPAGPLLGPALPGYALAASHGSALLSVALVVGLIALLGGLVLLSTGMLARARARGKRGAPQEADGDEIAELGAGAALT